MKKFTKIQNNVRNGVSWLNTLENTMIGGVVAIPLFAASLGMFEGGVIIYPTKIDYNQENYTSNKPASGFVARELDCLARNIYFEARGESIQGQKAVANVTLNRVISKHYPSTVCGVVYQNAQFSWTLENYEYKRIKDAKSWEVAKRVAKAVYDSPASDDNTYGSTHYYAHDLISAPFWVDSGYDVVKLAAHTYMKLKNGV